MKTTARCLTTLCAAAALFCSVGVVSAADDKAPAKGERQRERRERASTTQLAGQGEPGRLAARGQIIEKWVAELNLTDEQKAKVADIQKQTREKLQSLRGELKDLSPQDRRARIREAVGDIREKIEAVLTEEQKAQLKEKLEQAKEKRAGKKAAR